MLLYWYICIFSHSTATGFNKVKGVSLGGWLVVEKWIKPSLFDGIPNGDMLDGYQVQFKSVTLQKYVSASNGGGMSVTVDRDIPSAWETFKNHWNTFVTAKDFRFLAEHGINTVKIPVGWWIVDPHPPAPFVGGALAALDKAFSWARNYNIRCIIDLHAAPGSQNGFEHSASRDGSVNWPLSPSYISQSLDAIEFLCARYADNPAFLGIELLNGPLAAAVPLDILVSYYKQGYQIVRKYSSTAYVIVCQRTGTADPMELVKENIGDINVVIDVHYYNLFSPHYDKLNSSQNIESIYRSRRAELEALNSANGPLVFVGEWVNEWNVRNASQLDYQKFGRAQLEVYDTASFGWSFWTLKSALKHWDFQWSIKNEYLVLD